jgi:hypothetical protein
VIARRHYGVRALRRLGFLRHFVLPVRHRYGSETFTIPLIEGRNEVLLYEGPSTTCFDGCRKPCLCDSSSM